jgi:iron complex transport system substrate-binding protein
MSTKKIKIAAFALICGILLVLAGCGGQKEEPNQENQPANEAVEEANSGSENNQPQEEPQAEQTRTIEHAMGTATIPVNPERVVILTNHGAEAMLALGVKPVGAVQSWTGDPWYDHIADQMEGVEVVGLESEVTLEAVAALQPDLIIGNKMRQEKDFEKLNAIAPTVFEETLRGDWKVNFDLIAEALNKQDKADEVLAAYEQRITDLQSQLGDKLGTKVSMVRFMPSDVRIYQKDSFSGIILQDLGFARPESQDVDAFAEMGISKERIPAMDGDILFYFTYDKGDGEGVKVEDEWIQDPLFQNLNVAKSGNIHKVQDDIWNTAGGVIAANLMLDDIHTFFLE